jgi:hypothetical protein
MTGNDDLIVKMENKRLNPKKYHYQRKLKFTEDKVKAMGDRRSFTELYKKMEKFSFDEHGNRTDGKQNTLRIIKK